MFFWWGFIALFIVGLVQARSIAVRQSVIAEISYFLTDILPLVRLEPGTMEDYYIDLRAPSMSMNYATTDGITILAGIGRRRTYVEVGASDCSGGRRWTFDAIAAINEIKPGKLAELINRCRSYRDESKSAFLVYWPRRGEFLDARRDYGFSPGEQKHFNRFCDAQRNQYL